VDLLHLKPEPMSRPVAGETKRQRCTSL